MIKKHFLVCKATFSLLIFAPSPKAEAHSVCRKALYITAEYRTLIQIASENKARREALMRHEYENQEEATKTYLLHAIRYEENKAQIYIGMLEKLLRRPDASFFTKTSGEIKRRLHKSLDAYENFSLALREIEAFEETPIHAPMSPLVARFVDD